MYKELFNKLTKEQQEDLIGHLEQINYIFTEDCNAFNEKNIEEYYRSKLYGAIETVMYEFGKWC